MKCLALFMLRQSSLCLNVYLYIISPCIVLCILCLLYVQSPEVPDLANSFWKHCLKSDLEAP